MSEREIWHQVRIKAVPSEVLLALTQPGRLGCWWIPDVRGDAREGGILEFWYGENCQEMMVAELASTRVRWRAGGRGLPDWVGTEVSFELQPAEGATVLDFHHRFWRQDAALFAHSSWAWAVFLTSLKDYLETGTGFPLPNRWIG